MVEIPHLILLQVLEVQVDMKHRQELKMEVQVLEVVYLIKQVDWELLDKEITEELEHNQVDSELEVEEEVVVVKILRVTLLVEEVQELVDSKLPQVMQLQHSHIQLQ